MMYAAVQAKVCKEERRGTWFHVLAVGQSLTDAVKPFAAGGILQGELRIDDGRTITSEQRRKTYATIRDIADWNGDLPEALKEHMKYMFIAATGEEYFSLSRCSVATARLFVNFLIDFAMEWGIPLRETALDRTDDIDAAVYSSLKHRRCILCGQDGDMHHWDAIGMGRNRATVDDSSLRKICLCRKHHGEAHQIGRAAFEEKYHVYGIVYE